MKLAVEILTGSLFYVDVENEATVGDLKREIEVQQKLPHERMVLFVHEGEEQRLVKGGNEGDDTTLVACGIEDGFHLYLYFTPPPDDDLELASTRHDHPPLGYLEETNKQSRQVIHPKEIRKEMEAAKEQGDNGKDEDVKETEKEDEEDKKQEKEDQNVKDEPYGSS